MKESRRGDGTDKNTATVWIQLLDEGVKEDKGKTEVFLKSGLSI